MLSRDKTLCFTGHRPDKLGTSATQDWIREKLAQAIYKAYSRGYTDFICGGALGVDWMAAEEVLSFKEEHKIIKLTIALPFKGYNARWSEATVSRFEEKILNRADLVFCVSIPPYAAWKTQERNEWMVNNSNSVVAVWNGSAGGTANTVAYARRVGRPVYRIDPLAKTEEWMKKL